MRRTSFLLWLFLWPLFLGIFLPYCPLPGGLRLLNIFWGTVYGLGLWGVDKTVGLSIQSSFVALGVVIWPVIISAVLYVFGRRLQESSDGKVRSTIILALIVSSLPLVTLSKALQPPFSNLPTFYRLFFVVW